MSEQPMVQTDAYWSYDVLDYHQKGTVFFQFDTRQPVPMREVLENRLGWSDHPAQERNRYIVQRKRNGAYAEAHRASLVVTDNPTDVYGYIDNIVIQRWLKLSDIQAAATPMGYDIASWPELFALGPKIVGAIIAMPFMMYCQKNRQSEQDVLGYKRISWEEFASLYTIVEDTYNHSIFLFPKEKVTSYAVWYHHQLDTRTTPEMTLSFENYDADGKELAWIQTTWRRVRRAFR
jgi:hypothetical protein